MTRSEKREIQDKKKRTFIIKTKEGERKRYKANRLLQTMQCRKSINFIKQKFRKKL